MIKVFRNLVLALCLIVVAAGPLAAQSPKPTSKVIQTAASTGNGSVYSSAGRYEHLTIVIDFSAGGSGGVLSIEEAATSAYAGTWSVVTTVTQTAASAQTAVHVDGVFTNLRARFTSNISGGTATVTVYTHVER
jgi:PKD repeat protein